jgi:hypothetical protein
MKRPARITLAAILLALTAGVPAAVTVAVTGNPATPPAACHDPSAPAGTTGSVDARTGGMSAPYNGTGLGLLCNASGAWVPLPYYTG